MTVAVAVTVTFNIIVLIEACDLIQESICHADFVYIYFFSKSFFWVILFRPFSPLPPTPPSALYPFLPLQVLAHALISLSFRRNKYYCLYLSLLVLPITVFYFDLKSNVEITYIHIYIYIFMLYQDRTEAYV